MRYKSIFTINDKGESMDSLPDFFKRYIHMNQAKTMLKYKLLSKKTSTIGYICYKD